MTLEINLGFVLLIILSVISQDSHHTRVTASVENTTYRLINKII